jgi:hypothetical protein
MIIMNMGRKSFYPSRTMRDRRGGALGWAVVMLSRELLILASRLVTSGSKSKEILVKIEEELRGQDSIYTTKEPMFPKG